MRKIRKYIMIILFNKKYMKQGSTSTAKSF